MPERSQRPISIPTAPLPKPISQNIEAIVALHANAERNIPRHQRVIGAITYLFSRSLFLYGTVISVILWTLFNVLPSSWGFPAFDPPPFSGLDVAMGFSSLLTTISVLIRQERQEKLAEQRTQLSLQLSLLSEQKIAKIIALLEELRKDLPDVENRHDPEARVMQRPADPEQVLTTLEEKLATELAEIKQEKFID